MLQLTLKHTVIANKNEKKVKKFVNDITCVSI